MIVIEKPPLPTVSPTVDEDPLMVRATLDAMDDEEKKRREKELAKAEAEAARMHVLEQDARIEAINQQITSDIDTVPVLGDMAAMMKPQMEPLRRVPGLNEPDAFEIRGYLDAEGNATPEGELFLELQDSGIYDEAGNLTMKGKAFAMSPDESLESPVELFAIRDEAGLEDDADLTFADAVGGVGGYLWDAVKAGARTYTAASTGGIFTTDAEIELNKRAMMMGGAKAQAQLGAGVFRAAEKLWLEPGEDRNAYYLSKQDYKRSLRDVQNMEYADLVGAVTGSAEVLAAEQKARDARIAEVGPEKAAQIEKEAEAFGGLVLDPSNAVSFGTGFFFNPATKAPTIFAKLSQTVEKAAVLKTQAAAARTALAAAESTAARSARIAELAANQSDNLASIGDDVAAQATRGMANRYGAKAFAAQTTSERLAAELAQTTQQLEKTAIRAGGAQAILSTIETARQLKAVPFNAIAATTESVGNMLIKADEGLSNIVSAIGISKDSQKLLKYFGTGVGVTVNPALAAIPGVLAAGPVLKGVANLSRIIGKETLAARGSLPFWRRVSQNSAAGPLARGTSHLFDEMTLGGKVFAPIRATKAIARGAAVAAPMDVAFEVLGSGGEMDSNTIKRALAESLVFGGSGALAGSVVRGSLEQKRAQQAGDEINFRSALSDGQKSAFTRMGSGARKTLATFSALNPSLNINLTESGPSAYHRNINTATINVNQSDWLKPLVAHEVNHYIAARAQMEPGISALVVGLDGVAGLMRKADGTLDPTYKAAMDVYNDRMAAQGDKALTPEEFAVEYFNESTVDDLVGMVESGEYQKLGRRTDTERVMREIAASFVSKVPIIRDMAIQLGAAYDKGGNMVQGNGLLAGGVRELPGAKKLLRSMLKKSAGRVEGPMDSRVTEKGASKEKGIALPKEMVRDTMADSLFSLFETDREGNVLRDKDGDPIPLTRATDAKRQLAGRLLIDMQESRIRAGEQLPVGGLTFDNESGNWKGTHLDPAQIKALEDSGIFNERQLATLRGMNNSAKKRDGSTWAMIYQQSLVKGKNGKPRYESVAPTFREVVPVEIVITQAGNILVQTMSVTQLVENVRERAGTKLGKRLYNGDQNAMMRDVENVLALHRQGKRTDAYFAEKYGEGDGPAHKNFINTLFGLMTKAQQDINPLFNEEGIKYNSNVFKSRRLDRINHSAKLQGRPALPFGYTEVKGNYFPLGIPEGSGGEMKARRIKNGIKIGEQVYNRQNPAPPEVALEAAKKLADPTEPGDFGRILSEAGHREWDKTVPGAMEYRNQLGEAFDQQKKKSESLAEQALVTTLKNLGVTEADLAEISSETTAYTLSHGGKDKFANLIFRGESSPPILKSVRLAGGDQSGISKSSYPVVEVELSNGSRFLEKIRVSDHAQVSSNAPRHYQYDYRAKTEKEAFAFNEFEDDMNDLASELWDRQRSVWINLQR